MPFDERKAAYDGRHHLRHELRVRLRLPARQHGRLARGSCVQRGHPYAIVDEVDSILIDEARTPLIISGEPETAAQTYYDFARIVKRARGRPRQVRPQGRCQVEDDGADFEFDEKHKTVAPRESAIEKVERALRIENLYDPRNAQLVNHLIQALKAQSLYQRDVDYVIQDGEVKIVDEFTGRIMEGRRWSEGLHQAVEAKEGVAIQEEHVTLATITLQNYFRLYEKLAGMTGTAKTEEKEFVEIYDLHVVEIPTNVPVARDDENDLIFKTKEAKFDAVVDDIKERHEKGQPVLVGTISVETSEYLSQLLSRAGIPHNVLNAKQHEREAEIIKDAGQLGAVTIATNMAGRGVDIKLGEGVRELGGLYVLGTERHESRRIDNQLRGRSGRQGDPGETRFYLSAEDELVRLFAGDRIYKIMERFKLPADEPMTAGVLSRQIEGAQKKVEEQNFVARKNVLKYDDVMNMQRMVIYEQRRACSRARTSPSEIRDWIDGGRRANVDNYTAGRLDEEWDLDGPLPPDGGALRLRRHAGGAARGGRARRARRCVEEFLDDALDEYTEKEQQLGGELMRELERFVMLQVVDTRWREHLESMDYLREGVCASSSGSSCSRSSTSAGASTSRTWTTCARASTCARWRRRTRSSSTARGPRDVRGARPPDPRGGRADALPRRARAGGGDLRAAGGPGRPGARHAPALLRARVGRGRAGDRRRGRRRGGRRDRGRQHGGGVRGRAGGDPAASPRRARADRPQRPVLVRLRQEVQEVPRRLSGAPSARARLRRHPERGSYDRQAIDAILDEALVAHVGFVHDGQPYVIPVLHARIGDELYLHGASSSRMVRALSAGGPVCATVTLLDGLVVARSLFEQSPRTTAPSSSSGRGAPSPSRQRSSSRSRPSASGSCRDGPPRCARRRRRS